MADEAQWVDLAWMQRGLDALRESLDVNPQIKQEMIEFLFTSGIWKRDELTFDAAITRFNECLNPGKRSKHFKLVEIWVLMKRFERYALFYAMAEDLGFEVRRKPTEERKQELMERIVAALEENNRIAAYSAGELGRLDGGELVSARIHPALRDRSGLFSFDDKTF